MKSLSLLRLGAVALAIASTGHAGGPAQAQALNDQIVGTWTLAEVYDEYPGGKTDNPWGPGVKGQLTYSLNGRFSLMIMAADRPKGTDPRTPVGPALAYFGSYVIRDQQIVHLTERSTFPNWEGIERPLATTVSGESMKQTAPQISSPNGPFVPHLNWARSR